MSKKQEVIENVKLDKLVHGGQCLGATAEGKKIFVWGGLPGELVNVRVIKKKSSFLEGIVTDVIKPSDDRVDPLESQSYLSTSPWQIMTFESENKAKQAILTETFEREGIEINFQPFVAGDKPYGYRNKQEFGFWGDDNGLNLAHYVRGTHGKQIIESSALTTDSINKSAVAVRDELRRLKVWGGDLKTLVLRCSAKGDVVGALFIKKKLDLVNFEVPEELKGLVIYYSDPKSPASVPTKQLYSFGDITLTDTLMGNNITYDVMSFFQVNIPVFELALKRIDYFSGGHSKIDMYSGVGSIGVCIGMTDILVESDLSNIEMAKKNVGDLPIKVVHATSEKALEYIDNKHCLIVDPPRAGLHSDVVDRILEVAPPQIVYLSCNPSTQARDVKLLSQKYKIRNAEGYNFFPRTPHIESLVILELS